MTQAALRDGDELERALAAMRPKLHRYCARMAGSVIDGEDIVQDAMVKALEARPVAGAIVHLDGWLFRIAHNAALDHLRRRARIGAAHADIDLETAEGFAPIESTYDSAAASLQTLMRLAPSQRSAVVLRDVLGYSLDEIAAVTDMTIAAVKAALHRGRARLRGFARDPVDEPAPLPAAQKILLAAYVERFNARDMDSVRAMLAEEVRLDLVARHRLAGRTQVQRYFTNYESFHDWRLVPGTVEGRAAALVCDPGDPQSRPRYFVLLDWADGQLAIIRDFRYAPYAMEGAVVRR
jgi:RNA polymerase sigma-70 factor (ECF subfamily)